LISTASVALSRLLDIDALPAFLGDLGFKAVTFSYPLTNLNSSFAIPESSISRRTSSSRCSTRSRR
jgi:hypothetical protein